MTDWYAAVREQAMVYRPDGIALGKAIAYCDGPMVLVETTDQGDREWIRASILTAVDEPEGEPS